ncbi:MAG: acyl-CoA dehydrogenase family protein [Vulcanisaeta sp.]
MDFDLGREEALFRNSVRELGERYIKPHWIDLDEGKYSLLDLMPRLSEHGLIGLTLSSKYGGSEGSFLMAAMTAEELIDCEKDF